MQARILGTLIAAVAVALIATATSAVVLKGRGELVAYGSGLAVVELRGVLRARGIGLLVVEPDAEVETQGMGRATELADGRILYEGFGRVRVRSLDQRTRVELAGAGIRLQARGVGRAFLKGRGGYHTDDLDGEWGPESEIEFESDVE